MITAIYILKASPTTCKDILEVLNSIIGRTQYSSGCIKSSIWNNTDDPQSCMVFEVWKTKKDLELHMRSKIYRRMLAVMEMSMEEPEIKFIENDVQLGMEWLQTVLQSDYEKAI